MCAFTCSNDREVLTQRWVVVNHHIIDDALSLKKFHVKRKQKYQEVKVLVVQGLLG